MAEAELRGILHSALKPLTKDLTAEDENVQNMAASSFSALSVHGKPSSEAIAI